MIAMTSLGNLWAQSHRMAQVISFAALIAGLVIYFALCSPTPELVSTEREEGTLVEIHRTKSNDTGGGRVVVGRVKLDNGKEVRIFLPKPVPTKEGVKIPLRVELYEDGSKHYIIDHVAWLDMSDR
ncbi:MAG: hypothetical protein GY847_04975 [Proteobacteria bacterium]|nr:hypothetical protein [Pseudomonadota bacterium]